MKLEKIKYPDLNSRQKEIYNFQKVAALLADFGFNCIKLADDWQGADFLAYHKDGASTLKVQLKSRLHIKKEYEGTDLYIAFPIRKAWYLIAHDELVVLVAAHTPWLESKSWRISGGYSSDRPNQELIVALHSSRLCPNAA